MSSHDRRAGLRRGVSFMLVLMAHVALLGAALHWRTRDPIEPTTATLAAMMIDLTPLPTAPPSPPTEVPPGLLQEAQMYRESELESLPQPKLELLPDLDAVGDLYTPPPEAATASAPGAEQTSAPPAVNAAPDTRYAAEQTTVGSSDQAVVTWQSVLLGHLERFKRYPRRAERLRQEGVVYVRFSVDRRGNVHNGRLERSSGYPALDEETLAVVQRANPVPPPPPEIAGDPVEVMVPVTFYLGRRISGALAGPKALEAAGLDAPSLSPRRTCPGAVFFEKVRGPDARFQDILTGFYHELRQGYKAAEIFARTRSFKGVLEPFSTEGNLGLLRRAGFVDVLTIFRHICFEGFLCIK